MAAPDVWAWYWRQSASRRLEAEFRLEVLEWIAASLRINTGLTKSTAVVMAASHFSVGIHTIWDWLGLVAGLPQPDWLPPLCPLREPAIVNLPTACIISRPRNSFVGEAA